MTMQNQFKFEVLFYHVKVVFIMT